MGCGPRRQERAGSLYHSDDALGIDQASKKDPPGREVVAGGWRMAAKVSVTFIARLQFASIALDFDPAAFYPIRPNLEL